MKKLKLNKKKDNRRWLGQYGDKRANLEYPNTSMIDALMEVSRKYPEYYAYEYFGNKVTYRVFMRQIEDIAKALKNYGVEKDDRVTICMPSTPEAICMVYAVNLIGAVSSMIHPLSSEKEIENYINQADSKFMLTLDITLEKVMNIKRNTKLQKIIVASAGTSMPPLMRELYKITNYKKNVKLPKDDDIVPWNKFISSAPDYVGVCHEPRSAADLAVILYSGGTTGTPKGIMLSNLCFNALALEAHEMIDQAIPGNSVLALLPIFHGFGLAVCIHAPLLRGMKCILIPQFDAKKFGELIKKNRPNFIVGVPTLYEALLKQKLREKDLECVEAAVSGGDILSPELKKKVDNYLKEHGSNARVRVGYGLTEATAATCLSKENTNIEGCIGFPLPDTYFKIVKIDTHEEAGINEDGEICISGPTIMTGYLNNDAETHQVLRYHEDGKVWLHTGDIGCMMEDGTVIFKQRLKRMIVSSGYNVYPSYIENIIISHPSVLACTVIGIPHKYRGQVAKAYIVLKDGIEPTSEIKKEIQELCNKNISKYAIPKEYEYRKQLPKTLVGKVAFTKLEEESK
ncbi:MAG: acyl--CoA ligase [Firmicutes bacterium]|nr:acyl--CoA ligase [Bacillota bacterium]